jgi:hypothetical protein
LPSMVCVGCERLPVLPYDLRGARLSSLGGFLDVRG